MNLLQIFLRLVLLIYIKSVSSFLEAQNFTLKGEKTFLNISANNNSQLKSDRSYGHTYSEKVISSGFDFEEHKILTKDGYILTAWRIPRRRGQQPFTKQKNVVILQHGVLDDSWTWFTLQPQNCLPILLASEGYDVWLTNSRGNMFSFEHLNPKYDWSDYSSLYWNFTFHEMAVYDLPANVEYIKNITRTTNLSYIGHSQGTFQFFLSFLINPEFMQTNIDKFVSLGTIVTIFNIVN
jgi:lysosomal acid lipase/cholesteryl ester hydrolase